MIITIFGEKAQVVFAQYNINQNTALELCDPDDIDDYMVSATSNTSFKLPEHLVGIKTWSENTGVVEELVREGIIIDEEVLSIPTGLVTMPVYKLTDAANAERIKQLEENKAELARYEAMDKEFLDNLEKGE